MSAMKVIYQATYFPEDAADRKLAKRYRDELRAEELRAAAMERERIRRIPSLDEWLMDRMSINDLFD